MDAVQDEVPDEFYDADFLFQHPPYGLEIGIPYAGSMYADPTGKLSGSDLGQMQWGTFIQTLNYIKMKYYTAMAPGARMGILMGDVRRKLVWKVLRILHYNCDKKTINIKKGKL